MATVLSEFPRVTRPRRNTNGLFLDGQIWRLVQGEDYTSTTTAKRSSLASSAHRLGLRLRSRRDMAGPVESLTVQAVKFQKDTNGQTP